jgi:DNA polymerase V
MFALCDANNFYCSCERAFDPSLRGIPVVVLSNNDGCVIARSQEAKEIGIENAAPWFKVRKWANSHGVRYFSSNYTLYGDMSRRVMDVLRCFSLIVEPYSIDEMFLDLSGQGGDLKMLCRSAREAVLQATKIPACFGIGETKTKAKLANRLAKQHPELGGVCDLRRPEICAKLYPTIPAADVWGIGEPTARLLYKHGIVSVAQLAALDRRRARAMMTVMGERLVMELNGLPCLDILPSAHARKMLNVTRTFGQAVTTWDGMAGAVATYAARLGEKLREQQALAPVMTVFIQTNRFVKTEIYCNYATFAIEPTQDTLALTKDALRGVRSIWREGFKYWKAGILAHDLIPVKNSNLDFLPSRDPIQSEKLMTTMDGINAKFGNGMLRPAVSGTVRSWETKADYRSPRYTTHIGEILKVKA